MEATPEVGDEHQLPWSLPEKTRIQRQKDRSRVVTENGPPTLGQTTGSTLTEQGETCDGREEDRGGSWYVISEVPDGNGVEGDVPSPVRNRAELSLGP